MFESLSSTPSYAQRLLDLARSGFAQHGRGCVFVRASLNRRYSKQTVGGKAVTATCTTGEPLSADPELLLQSLATDYLPASLVAAGPVYDTPESLVPGLVDMGRTQQQSSATGVTDGASASSAAAGHDPAVEELQRAMRGMDTARLCTLMGGARQRHRRKRQTNHGCVRLALRKALRLCVALPLMLTCRLCSAAALTF